MSDNLKPYSIHSFMLPFRWDYLPATYDINKGKEEFNFDERTNLGKFLECLLHENSKWKRKFFKIGSKVENFNEFHYFHAYANKSLFDLQQVDEKNDRTINGNKVMVYFELPVNPITDRYTIKTISGDCLKLILTGISLHVYNTGVAVLTINIENNEYDLKEDILKINEYGRRLYPQFLNNQSKYTEKVKKSFLADSIEITITGMEDLIDDFSEYENLSEREVHHYSGDDFKRTWVVKLPKYIRGLFGNKFSFIQADEKPDSIRFNILTDDRMFFQCWYGNEELTKSLQIKKEEIISPNDFIAGYDSGNVEKNIKGNFKLKEEVIKYQYLDNPFWYAYLFGDKAYPSIANSKMQEEITQKHTYTRWANYGTLYGFSRDSFVAFSTDVPTLLKNDVPDLRMQMKTMYYQMAVLCVAQSASVLRFSAEVSNLADIAMSDENEKLIKNIKVLYKNYIEFINKIYYREITPYVQGLEMYNQFQEIMQLKENVKDLDEELNELFTYIKLEEDEVQSKQAKEQTDEAHKLTLIASIFLPATFLATVFAFFATEIRFQSELDWSRIIAVFILILIVFSAIVFYKRIISWIGRFL
jgi:CorA-like Mg2+ transporter protein